MTPSYAPIALQHINITVPKGGLDLAREFYKDVVGFGEDPVPQKQKDILLWSFHIPSICTPSELKFSSGCASRMDPNKYGCSPRS